jgi:hypothetical protein
MEKTLAQEEQIQVVPNDVAELGELQLALVGGGIGETVL